MGLPSNLINYLENTYNTHINPVLYLLYCTSLCHNPTPRSDEVFSWHVRRLKSIAFLFLKIGASFIMTIAGHKIITALKPYGALTDL